MRKWKDPRGSSKDTSFRISGARPYRMATPSNPTLTFTDNRSETAVRQRVHAPEDTSGVVVKTRPSIWVSPSREALFGVVSWVPRGTQGWDMSLERSDDFVGESCRFRQTFHADADAIAGVSFTVTPNKGFKTFCPGDYTLTAEDDATGDPKATTQFTIRP